MEDIKKLIKKLIYAQDVVGLCRCVFKDVKAANNLTPTQIKIVKWIAFSIHKRVAINCYTRYGKTQCVAIGVCLYILINTKKRIALIAPQDAQTKILRDYVAELISRSSILTDMLELQIKESVEKIRREVSRQRMTFKNGCEVRTLSAEGEATRLMGFGGDLVIKDESCLITDVANAKIMRMLGDDPEGAVLIEISNPWNTDNSYYRHYNSPDFHTIHVGWQTGLKEGRITQQFVNQMRDEYADTPLHFKVLYDSEFPNQADDSIFNRKKILEAVNADWKDLPGGTFVLGCDVADKGADRTVIMTARTKKDHYWITDIYSEAKSENTAIAGRLYAMQQKVGAISVNIDTIGLGVGVVSMLNEKVAKNCRVYGCHFGRSAKDKTRFLNKKAEMYFRLKTLFNENRIKIPNHRKLINELVSMKWDYTSSGKIKIIDPTSSPDFADSLIYTIWLTKRPVF